MGGEELLSIDPAELEFPFELKKQISVSFQLSNKTDHHIAFKVKTTNPKKYSVRPNNGVVLPRSTSNVVVTMQAQREAPPDMQCKDRFLVQSVVARPGATPKDINPEMFNKETGNHVEDCKLRVVYVSPPKPPSPVPEESEEGSPPRASESENGHFNTSELDAVSGEHVDVRDSSTEARALFSKLNKEKNVAMQQNNKLRQELVNNTKYGMYVAQQDSLNLASDLVSLGRFAAIVGSGCMAVFETMIFLRNGGPKISSGFENELLKRGSARGSNGLPLLYVVLIGLLGILMGYLMKKNS